MQERKEGVRGVLWVPQHYRGSAFSWTQVHSGPLIPLLWTSNEVSFAFQSQSEQLFIFCLNFSWTHVYELMPLFRTSDDLSSGAQIKLKLGTQTVTQSVN